MKIKAKVVKSNLTSNKCLNSTRIVFDSAKTQESMVLQARAQTQTQLSFEELIFQNKIQINSWISQKRTFLGHLIKS